MGERDTAGRTETGEQEAVRPIGGKPGVFRPRNIAIVVAGVLVASALAVLTVGNVIAPSIERRTLGEASETAKSGSSSYLEKLQFFSLDPLIVNPADSNGERYLKASVTMEMYDESVRDELEKRLPQIKNQINNVLSSKTIDQVRTNEDKERLRREILNRVNGMLITGRISNVYFEEFVYQ